MTSKTADFSPELHLHHRSNCRHLSVTLALCALALCAASAASPGFDPARYHGRVVVLDFWASWCKPCRQSIPWLNEMHSRYGAQGLVVIGINVDAQRVDAERFLRDTPIHFESLFDPGGDLARHYSLRGMPTTLVFGRDGKLRTTHVGFQGAKKDAREAALRSLLTEDSR